MKIELRKLLWQTGRRGATSSSDKDQHLESPRGSLPRRGAARPVSKRGLSKPGQKLSATTLASMRSQPSVPGRSNSRPTRAARARTPTSTASSPIHHEPRALGHLPQEGAAPPARDRPGSAAMGSRSARRSVRAQSTHASVPPRRKWAPAFPEVSSTDGTTSKQPPSDVLLRERFTAGTRFSRTKHSF